MFPQIIIFLSCLRIRVVLRTSSFVLWNRCILFTHPAQSMIYKLKKFQTNLHSGNKVKMTILGTSIDIFSSASSFAQERRRKLWKWLEIWVSNSIAPRPFSLFDAAPLISRAGAPDSCEDGHRNSRCIACSKCNFVPRGTLKLFDVGTAFLTYMKRRPPNDFKNLYFTKLHINNLEPRAVRSLPSKALCRYLRFPSQTDVSTPVWKSWFETFYCGMTRKKIWNSETFHPAKGFSFIWSHYFSQPSRCSRVSARAEKKQHARANDVLKMNMWFTSLWW